MKAVSCMKPETDEWIQKAEDDFEIASLLRRRRKHRHYDAICFHCQQCVEKYLKARLVEANIAFPKIHDLARLLDRALPVEPLWGPMRLPLQALTEYAVEFRYPGEFAAEKDAHTAYQSCKEIRKLVRESLGLKYSKT